MKTRVYIDNNVWDFLFSRRINLSIELPTSEFCLYMTREAEFEIPPIPNGKADLKEFIDDTIKKCVIKIEKYFGFFDENHSEEEQRVGDADVGRWITSEESRFIEQQKTKIGTVKKAQTRLYKNEADISIAARAMHYVVITSDILN